MKFTAPIIAAVLALGVGTSALAAPIGDKPVGLSYGAVAGSLALGSEVIYTHSNAFSVRAVQNGVRAEASYDFQGTNFDVEGRISSFGIMLDLHPTDEMFRISAGVRRNTITADLSTTFDNDFEYGGTSYSESGPTTLTGRIQLPEITPVATVGWRGSLRENIDLTAEFGAMYIGTPDVSLSASGGAAEGSNATAFNDEVENHRQSIEDSLGRLGIYPIAQIGLSMRF
jgi:hypothetical protein